MLQSMILEQIDCTIKQAWINNISKDYFADYMLKEDSLKCCFYYHLRRKLAKLLQEHHLRIYPEYYFPELGYRADLAIVQIDPTIEEGYLGDAVTDVIAIIELKYTASDSNATARWVKKDISKIKSYLQTGKLVCQYYFGVIYEVECSALAWMDKRSTNSWAKGFVTELNAGYIDGKMRFEVNSYNGLNTAVKESDNPPYAGSDWDDPRSLLNRWLNDPNPVGVCKSAAGEIPPRPTKIDDAEAYPKEKLK